MSAQDVMYIVISVCVVFISVPLVMVLWKVYQTLEPIHGILKNVNNFSRFLVALEAIPSRFINRFFR